jgi:hypothetical protein
MAKTKEMAKMKCAGNCGMHLCCQCALPQLIFGILFIVAGFGLWAEAPAWFNGWSILGIYLGLWGLMAMMKKN